MKIIFFSLFFFFISFSCLSVQSVYDNTETEKHLYTNSRWYALEIKSPKPYFYNFSFLLDPPAGKHGFIQSDKRGNLKFADGTQIKFFGVNIVADNCFPDKFTARQKSFFLSEMGVNLVRLHHMDAPWANPSLIDYQRGSSRYFNTDALDKLDYLIAQLEEKGIYIYLDLLVHRKFLKSDGIKEEPKENGAKLSGMFDPSLIKLEKEYAEKLLTHYNPYTKKRYIDDPAIIASEFINESSVFLGFGGYNIAPYYDKELDNMWKHFLVQKNIGSSQKRARFNLKYNDAATYYIDDPSVSEKEKKLSIEFYHNLSASYANEMKHFLRKLGVKYLLTESNFPLIINADVAVAATMDYSDFHIYWDHPKVWLINNDWSRLVYAPINNTPAVKNYNNFFSDSLKANISHKPFFLSEFNACFPNQYRITGLPLIAAYGSLQGFDSILFFDSGHLGETGYEYGKHALEPFALTDRPDALDLMGVTALIFERGYIRESLKEINIKIGKDYLYGHNSYNSFIDENKFLAFMQKTTISFDTNLVKSVFPRFSKKRFDETDGIVKSDTGELTFDYNQGYVKMNAPKVQGAAGFVGGRTFLFKNFQFTIKNEHAVVLLVSLDDKPLEISEKMLLTVLGHSKNSGQKFSDETKSLTQAGGIPVLYEKISGDFLLKNLKFDDIKIFKLSWDKNVKEKTLDFTNSQQKGLFSFVLTNSEINHYLVIVKK